MCFPCPDSSGRIVSPVVSPCWLASPLRSGTMFKLNLSRAGPSLSPGGVGVLRPTSSCSGRRAIDASPRGYPPMSDIKGRFVPAEKATNASVRRTQWGFRGRQIPKSTPIFLADVPERFLQSPGQLRVNFRTVRNPTRGALRGLESHLERRARRHPSKYGSDPTSEACKAEKTENVAER
jgi:hypothetical protein